MLQGSIFFYLSIISQDLVSKKTCQKKVCVFLSESFFNCITTNPLSSHAEGASHPVEGPLFPIHHQEYPANAQSLYHHFLGFFWYIMFKTTAYFE